MRFLSLFLLVAFGFQNTVFGQDSTSPKDVPAKDTKKRSGPPSKTKAYDYAYDLGNVLKLPTAQKDLELSDEQMKVIMDLNRKITQGHSKLYDEFPELKDKKLDGQRREEIYEEIRRRYSELRSKFQEQIMEQLVPRQRNLLKKVKLKHYLQIYGFSTTMTQTVFAKEFLISESQKEEMFELNQELEAEIRELILKKRQEGVEKMKKILSATQRKKFEELDGDKAKVNKF